MVAGSPHPRRLTLMGEELTTYFLNAPSFEAISRRWTSQLSAMPPVQCRVAAALICFRHTVPGSEMVVHEAP